MKVANDSTHFQIICIGAGANGSHFFRNLLQDIATYNSGYSPRVKASVVIADGDKVEKKNLDNQLFDREDVGQFKVDALAERYGTHYEIDVLAVPEYITSLESLANLFSLLQNSPNSLPILVGLVDNNRTRMLLHEFFMQESIPDLVYIDTGVEGVLLEQEVMREPSAKEMILSSGFSGQVVCGYKRKGQVFLPPVGDVYPTILTDAESVFPDQSCGDLILNNPQRSATNKLAAQMTNTFLNNLFHNGEIVQEELIFNARYGTSQARFISKRIEREYENFFKELTNHDKFSSVS